VTRWLRWENHFDPAWEHVSVERDEYIEAAATGSSSCIDSGAQGRGGISPERQDGVAYTLRDAAWNASDYEAIVEMCDPDVEWTFPIAFLTPPGRSGGVLRARILRNLDLRLVRDLDPPDRIADSGPHVVANEFAARGRDGIEVSMRFVHLWTSGTVRSSAFAGSERSTSARSSGAARVGDVAGDTATGRDVAGGTVKHPTQRGSEGRTLFDCLGHRQQPRAWRRQAHGLLVR